VHARPFHAARRRAGFTLIEILVVIAIIAILASLLLGAVMLFLNKGPDIRTKNDISQLSNALNNFKVKYGQYPPDRIKLCSNSSLYTTAALDQLSVSFLHNVMFKNLGTYNGMDWGNRNAAAPPASPVFVYGNPANPTVDILEGDQCLVFFLAGPPGMLGFSSNPQNPTIAGGDRIKFFDFDAGRLQAVSPSGVIVPAVPPLPALVRSPQFPSYIDHYGKMPYIYFSSGKTTGGYVNASSLDGGVAPYRTSTGFLLPSSFQIVSAGLNGRFGAGGLWTPGTGGANGKDDLGNFHGDKLLGVP
jgi:prepilin-type N-terminal cleavage/methylation domain-containing protein